MNKNIKEKISYNTLNIITESKYQKLEKLFKKYKSWKKALDAEKNNFKYNPEKEYEKLEKNNIKLILFNDLEYPKLLKEIPLPPFGLYVLGNTQILNKKAITIVGTRKATSEGKLTAFNFSKKLSQSGLIIVSGLALGIDSAAHLGCLEANRQTIAVLGGGFFNFYPKINEKLAKKIINSGGALISEYNIYSPSLAYRFLERNRITSGLSLGVLIIEAPKESGTLNTARYAIEQNRCVWVTPGPINHPNFYGSHELIKQGASLVTTPEDILKDLNINYENKNEKTVLSEEEKIIYNAIKEFGRPIDIDKIIEITNLKTQTVNKIISMLIIKNIVKETNQGYII